MPKKTKKSVAKKERGSSAVTLKEHRLDLSVRISGKMAMDTFVTVEATYGATVTGDVSVDDLKATVQEKVDAIIEEQAKKMTDYQGNIPEGDGESFDKDDEDDSPKGKKGKKDDDEDDDDWGDDDDDSSDDDDDDEDEKPKKGKSKSDDDDDEDEEDDEDDEDEKPKKGKKGKKDDDEDDDGDW